MKHYLLTFSFTIFSILLAAQTSAEETLATIENQEQAKQFIKEKHNFKSKVFVFNEEKHKTQIAKALFKLEKGQLKQEKGEYNKTLYKILDKTTKSYYRVSYIMLDGNTRSLEHINALRETIILKYNNGSAFNSLANQYSMDANAKKGGDTGWFTLGEMHPAFEDAITTNAHNLNDIYNIDIPSKNWYYVVLQTYIPKDITEIEVLKIVEPIN